MLVVLDSSYVTVSGEVEDSPYVTAEEDIAAEDALQLKDALEH